jgi:hypothetical protein
MAQSELLYEDSEKIQGLEKAREYVKSVQKILDTLEKRKIKVESNRELNDLFSEPLGFIRAKLYGIFEEENEAREIPLNTDILVNSVDFTKFREIAEEISQISNEAKEIIHLGKDGVKINESKYQERKRNAQVYADTEEKKQAFQAYKNLIDAMNEASKYVKIFNSVNELDEKDFKPVLGYNGSKKQFQITRRGINAFLKRVR